MHLRRPAATYQRIRPRGVQCQYRTVSQVGLAPCPMRSAWRADPYKSKNAATLNELRRKAYV